MYLPPREALQASIATGTWPDISPFTPVPLVESLFSPGLHWWQFDLLAEVAWLFRAGYRRVLLQLATGGGKTVIALSALLSARLQGMQAMFLVHRKELLKQTGKTFTSAALDHSFVAADFPYDPNAGLLLAGVQTLIRRLAKLLPPQLVIVDECFVAGTLVDGRPIESLQVGDYVTAFDEVTGTFAARRINRKFKNHAPRGIVRVNVADGRSILCTPEHPFWTKRGWVNAGVLNCGDEVLGVCSGVRVVRDHHADRHEKSSGRFQPVRENVLPVGMSRCSPGETVLPQNGDHQPKICIGSHDTQQPDAPRAIAREDEEHADRDWASAEGARRQRSTTDGCGVEADRYVRQVGVHSAVHRADPFVPCRHGLPDTLQNRCGESGFENCDRSGRGVTSGDSSAGTGLEEGRVSEWIGLDSVTFLQRADPEQHGDGSFDGYVYNIEVEGLHTYTANGIVVHNCHHAVSNTYAEILESYPDAFILLLTATPERLDGRGLEEQADVMVCGPQPRWLIDNGYLSDGDVYAPDVPDFTGVPSTAGEYRADAAAAVMNQPKLVGNVVEHYLSLAKGDQGIVFGQNVQHSKDLAAAFNGNGIPAMHVDGDTPAKERDRFDDAFRAGDILIGTNCDLFAEGYDVPNIRYLGDASRSKSRIKVKQRHGRVMRFKPGKRWVICDHAGNALPGHLGGQGHGLPDDEYEYTLQGVAAASAKQQDWTSITQCLECFRIYPSAAARCPGCTSERRAEPRVVKQVAGTLSKLERDAIKTATAARKKEEERECNTYDEMVSLGKARGYDYPKQWAARQCKFRRIAIPWGPQPMTSDSEEWAG